MRSQKNWTIPVHGNSQVEMKQGVVVKAENGIKPVFCLSVFDTQHDNTTLGFVYVG